MSVSDLMQAMADAGAPMAAILIAVRALEEQAASIAERDAEIERRRAVERERKRRQRDKDRDETVCVTGQSRDIDGTVTGHVTGQTPFPAPSPSFPPDPQTNPTPTHTPGDDTPRARKGDFLRPEWADAQVWADFLTNRKVKRLPCTATAHAKFLTDVQRLSDETGWPPGECLRACVARGWGAIFDPREKQNGGNHQIGGRSPDRRDGVAKALDRQLGLDGFEADRQRTGQDGGGGGGPVAYLAARR